MEASSGSDHSEASSTEDSDEAIHRAKTAAKSRSNELLRNSRSELALTSSANGGFDVDLSESSDESSVSSPEAASERHLARLNAELSRWEALNKSAQQGLFDVYDYIRCTPEPFDAPLDRPIRDLVFPPNVRVESAWSRSVKKSVLSSIVGSESVKYVSKLHRSEIDTSNQIQDEINKEFKLSKAKPNSFYTIYLAGLEESLPLWTRLKALCDEKNPVVSDWSCTLELENNSFVQLIWLNISVPMHKHHQEKLKIQFAQNQSAMCCLLADPLWSATPAMGTDSNIEFPNRLAFLLHRWNLFMVEIEMAHKLPADLMAWRKQAKKDRSAKNPVQKLEEDRREQRAKSPSVGSSLAEMPVEPQYIPSQLSCLIIWLRCEEMITDVLRTISSPPSLSPRPLSEDLSPRPGPWPPAVDSFIGSLEDDIKERVVSSFALFYSQTVNVPRTFLRSFQTFYSPLTSSTSSGASSEDEAEKPTSPTKSSSSASESASLDSAVREIISCLFRALKDVVLADALSTSGF